MFCLRFKLFFSVPICAVFRLRKIRTQRNILNEMQQSFRIFEPGCHNKEEVGGGGEVGGKRERNLF